MANIFDSLTSYQSNWEVTDRRKFNAAEVAAIQSASVVRSDFGKSVAFAMKGGGVKYIPLSNRSNKEIGDTIDVAAAELLTLHQAGNPRNAIRIEI